MTNILYGCNVTSEYVTILYFLWIDLLDIFLNKQKCKKEKKLYIAE